MQRTAVKKPTKAATITPALRKQSQRKLTTKKRPLKAPASLRKPKTFHSTTTSSPLHSSTTTPFGQSTQENTYSTTAKAVNAQLSMMDELNVAASLFSHNPKQAFSHFAQTKLSPHHHLSHQGAFRRMKHVLAQQTILVASALGLTAGDKTAADTPPPTTLNATDLPATLAPPINPMKKQPHHAVGENNAAGMETITAPSDGVVLEPVISDFIPPTPSRTIPIIHDGIEWDEPNFLFRPFIHVIDLVHETTGLPWWSTLIAWAWILRTSISPLTYKQQASTVRITLLQPDIMRINTELRQIDPKSNSYKAKQQELADLYKKNGVGPFTAMFWSLASIPFYVLSFIAIRNMANSPYFAGEFATGGFMPYMNLSASAGWELALVNALVNLVVLHVSQPIPVHKMPKLQKMMFLASHVLIMGFIPVLSNVNTASLMYFIANNSFSIFFQLLFYSNMFRKVAGLPTNAEVSAVRDIVTDMSTKQRQGEPMRKNAYVLENDKKVAVGQPDVLSQARELVNKKQEETKLFATGGATAVEEKRIKAERDSVAKQDETAKKMAELQRMTDFKNGVIPGKSVHHIVDNGPKQEAGGKAKTVQRKGWKKH